MRVIQHLNKAIRSAAVFNREVQVAPACILWPDHDRQWEPIISRLQVELPELFVLGDYHPENRIGPAIWLRCVISEKIDEVNLPKNLRPIFYLPGVSRQDLRAVESCPDHLKPLAELQYRGVIWSQINAKDWTILAFLKSGQGGLGLDVAQDNDAKSAMQLALYRLMDEELDLLRGKRLDKDHFNTLLTGGDPVRDLLHWLDQGEAFQKGRNENEWKAFVEVTKSQLAFNPQNEGVLAGSAKLAAHEGSWQTVWERYCEAPQRYPNIPGQIRKSPTPSFDMFADSEIAGGWPQWNEIQEVELRRDLMALKNAAPHDARNKILELETRHRNRRDLVWAELGESHLAQAMECLSTLAEITSTDLAAGTTEDLVAGYCGQGWKADDAMIRALSVIEKPEDFDAVSAAIRVIYSPWAEESARYLQKTIDENSYPGGTISESKAAEFEDEECVLFVDGLRFDVSSRLIGMLENSGYEVTGRTCWAALPSVTATGKPAVSPVRNMIRGEDASSEFEPCVAATGQSLKGGYHLKKLLTDNGWKILERFDNGDGKGNAWCEFGDIDHEGHDRGWKLAKQIDVLLAEIQDRIEALLSTGWKRVRIITDHGWLLLPGGLPKIELPSALTDNKWGRCASLKPGASTDERLYPWFWNSNQHFILADGISCFRNGEEYAHGGLSLQECLVQELIVAAGTAGSNVIPVQMTHVAWKGLRCTVAVDGEFSELSLDLRLQSGDPSSSIVAANRPLRDDGTASVVVEDEDLEGREATVVLIDANGGLVVQLVTVIGGDSQ